MDDSSIHLAELIGTAVLTIIAGLGGQRLLTRSIDKNPTPVEEQLNLRIAEKDKQIAILNKRIDDLSDDLDEERRRRNEDRARYQEQLDTLRQRFDDFRNNRPGGQQ